MSHWKIVWTEGGVTTLNHPLADRWDRFFETSGNVWHCREFIACWEKTIAHKHKWSPYLIHATGPHGQEVLYSLYARRGQISALTRTILEPPGSLEFDYQDPISIGNRLDPTDWDAFWIALGESATRKFPKLGYLQIHRLTPPFFGTITYARGVDATSPILDLKGVDSLEQVLQECGASHRSNARRRLKNAEKMGGISLEIIGEADFEQALEEMFEIYNLQWGIDGKAHIFQDPATRLFFRDLGHAALKLGKLHFSRLRVGADTWHFHFGLAHNKSMLWYKPTYHPNASKHSPGLVHLAKLIEYCCENGFRELDFGFGAETYKYLWTKTQMPLHSYRVQGTDRRLMAARSMEYYWERSLRRIRRGWNGAKTLFHGKKIAAERDS